VDCSFSTRNKSRFVRFGKRNSSTSKAQKEGYTRPMRSNQPTVFLVWEFNQVLNIDLGDNRICGGFGFAPPTPAYLEDILRTTHQDAQLRAIDTTHKQALAHKTFLEAKQHPLTTFYRIESCSANHLFASNQLGTQKRINKRGTRQC
jgi:hypothetical protein